MVKQTKGVGRVEAALAWLEGVKGLDEAPPAAERLELLGFTLDDLKALVVEGYGQKKFRAEQLFGWLYTQLVEDVSEMTNLSKSWREQLERTATLSVLEHVGSHQTADGTVKLQFKCHDGAVVETVFIPSENRNTLCISSQVGCAMGCTFCWTAKMGLRRHLTTAEIVEQVVAARRLMGGVNGHIGNIVFMGMGEPLHNYDNVVQAIKILTHQKGLDFSRRKVTVSTSGLVPAIAKLGEDVDVELAISLNGTTDEQRGSIMPVNDRWDIAELIEALRNYPLRKGQRITFEYVLIKGLNDTLADAKRLISLTHGIPSKINLIPFNPHPQSPFLPPSEETIDAFRDYLLERHISCFRRKTRGQEEMAACGQLGSPGDRPEPAHVRKKLAKFREA